MSVERFVGKAVEFKIGDTTYKMKCPAAKMIPKIIYLQNKYPNPNDWKNVTEEDFEKIVKVIENAIQRTYRDWTEDERDDFITQNFGILMRNLPLTLGVTEEQLEKAKESVKNENSNAKDVGE